MMYHRRKMLSGMGYRFDPSKLPSFITDAFMIIENEYRKIENENNKKALRRGRR